tara:strand:+ start:1679 stop:2236 length:558 start_codon:yes stop_codon:yes gene_type:complete
MAGKKILTQFALPVGSTSGSFGNGTAGQVLTTGGDSASMYWDDVTATVADGAIDSAQIASYAVNNAHLANNAVQTAHITDANVTQPKLAGWKTFLMKWDNASASTNGVTFSNAVATIAHNLNTDYIITSMLDVNDHFGNGADRYVDMNYQNDVVLQRHDANTTKFTFYNEPSLNDVFKVAMFGGG